jgi:hypothetical protein
LNSLSMPSRSSIAEICGPPPCTTTGRSPAYRRKTMSSANACLSWSSTMALPPYLITTVLPWNSSSQGSASVSTAALASARARRPLSWGPLPFAVVMVSSRQLE